MSKHLSLSDRAMIEKWLAQDLPFSYMAKQLRRSPSTISREVKLHRCFALDSNRIRHECLDFNRCLRNRLCHTEDTLSCMNRCKLCTEYDCKEICSQFKSLHCSLLNKPPYVCTCCNEDKSCKRNHAYYTAHRAHAMYLHQLSCSRQGIHTDADKLVEINNLIAPLLAKGQSLNHIFASHAEEIGVSERTLYNYIDRRAFEIRNIDLPKKVKYRQRREQRLKTKFEYEYRKGHSIEDFRSYMELHPKLPVIEMDTVKGARYSHKCLLTMIFRESNFMLVFLLPDGTQDSVAAVFDSLTSILGIDVFRKLFPVILTDNGVEFKDAKRLKFSENGARRTHLFYCDPQASWQKPQVEKNHELIRRILPKGTSFRFLTDEQIHLVTCHINSVAREMFDNRTPFDLMIKTEQKQLLESLSLFPIPLDEVYLKPALLKL